MKFNKDTSEEYAKFLDSYDWDYYCTFTTGYKMTLKSARRAMERLHSEISRSVSPNRFYWVAEPFDVKEGFHTHALLYFENRSLSESSIKGKSLDFVGILNSWKKVTKCSYHESGDKGIRSHLSRYQKGKGAHHYLGKYINKYQSTYDLLGNWKQPT